MAAKKHHLLEMVGLGAAVFAGYEWIYKPWKLNNTLASAASVTPSYPAFTSTGAPSVLSSVTSPTPIGYPITPSNLNPGGAVGGEVGACMSKKGLTQSDCTARLQKIRNAYASSVSQLQALQSGSVAATVQTSLAANQAAAASDIQNITAAKARGDAGAVIAYTRAYNEHTSNASALQTQLSGIPGQIIAFQAEIVSLLQNYKNYTGFALQ